MSAIRRITIIALTLLLSICMFVLSVHGEDVEIKAVIPARHTISGTVSNGDIIIDGKPYTGKFSVDILHSSAITLRFRPAAGYAIDKVVLGGQDITGLLQNGSYSVDVMLWDMTIDVSFKKLDLPSTKEATAYTIVGTFHIHGVPDSDITLELRGMDTKTVITDTTGKFRFDDVLEGSYTLTVVRNETIIGYLTLTITKGGIGVNITTQSDGSIMVTVEDGITMIELNMNLSDDGVLEFTTVKPIVDKKDLNDYPSPITTDNNNPLFLIVVMGISFGLLFVVTKKRQREA